MPFLHPSETEILNHLCKLGSHYKHFESFIKTYSILLPQNVTDETGMYKKQDRYYLKRSRGCSIEQDNARHLLFSREPRKPVWSVFTSFMHGIRSSVRTLSKNSLRLGTRGKYKIPSRESVEQPLTTGEGNVAATQNSDFDWLI